MSELTDEELLALIWSAGDPHQRAAQAMEAMEQQGLALPAPARR